MFYRNLVQDGGYAMKIGFLIRRAENEVEYMDAYRSALHRAMGKADTLIEIDSGTAEDVLEKKLADVDGICITGYKEPELIDIWCVRYATEKDLPLFAICQGIQDMALYTKDSVLPVAGHMRLDRKREYVHWVNIRKDSRLYRILKAERIPVNSCHNYMAAWNSSWEITGISDDGVIEAMERSEHPFQIRVQWHPELVDDRYTKRLFDAFIRACRLQEKAKVKEDRKHERTNKDKKAP